MKKFFYAFLALVLAIGSVFLEKGSDASAQSIISKVEQIPGVSADFTLDDGSVHKTFLTYLYANDQLSYCVEPIKTIHPNTTLEVSSSLDAATREKLSIISYHGYNNSNRHSDKWYMATQIMIWEELGHNFKLIGFDDYASYKQKICESMNMYHILPSFINRKVTLKQGEKTILKDDFNVLNQFANIQNDGSAHMNVNGNTLELEAVDNLYTKGMIHINKFFPEQLGLPIVYRGQNDESVQQIMHPHISQNISGSLEYRVQPYGYVKINKTGEILTKTDKQESAFGSVYTPYYEKRILPDVEIGVYAKENVNDVWGNRIYDKGVLVDTLISGKKDVSKELPAGKYFIKELKTVAGYVLDTKEYAFEIGIDENHKIQHEFSLYNKRAKVKIKLHKSFEEGSLLDLSEAYKDVNFGIYSKNDIYNSQNQLIIKADELVYLSGINQDGSLKEEADLPLGEYYLKEMSTNKHYLIDDNVYEFKVEENGQSEILIVIGNGELKNKLHRNALKILKKDKGNEKPLSAKFVLYDELMNEIETFKTDKNGSYVFENLVDGTYYLQEIEAPKGYALNPKLQKITLFEDVVYTMKNEKLPKEEPVVKTNDQANHQPMEMMMLGSMSVVYAWILRKLKI